MGQIGEILKAAREQKGISLSQAEEETKIRTKYLEALESEAWDLIPGRVYVKGFLSNYATYLGLDSRQILQALKEEMPPDEEERVIKKAKPVINEKKYRKKYRFKPKYFRYLLGILAIVTLVIFNNWWHNRNTPVTNNDNTPVTENNESKQNDKKEQKDSKEQQKAAENQTNPENQQAQAPPAQVTGAHLTLVADKGVSWISVLVDGQTVFEGNINQGETKNFDGNQVIKIRLGNAGALNVTFNGQNKGYLGALGQVVDQEFPAVQAGTAPNQQVQNPATNSVNPAPGTSANQ